MRLHFYLLGPREYDVFFQQVGVVQVFENDGDAGQQLTLMELHQALDATQEVLLSLFVIVAKLTIKRKLHELQKTCAGTPATAVHGSSDKHGSDVERAFAARTAALNKMNMINGHRWTHSKEVALVLLNLLADVLVEEQLTQDQRAHGSHLKPLRFSQDFLISRVDHSLLFLLLEGGSTASGKTDHITPDFTMNLFGSMSKKDK